MEGWRQHEAAQQWHRAELHEIIEQQVELKARAAHFEFAALSAGQQRGLSWRSIAEEQSRFDVQRVQIAFTNRILSEKLQIEESKNLSLT